MNEHSRRTVRILAVGDVFVDRPPAAADFSALAGLLASGDIVFGNCEGAYSSSPDRAPQARGPQVAATANAQALRTLGFDVMSLSNNHAVDGGHEGLRQTIEALRARAVRPVGAGLNLAEAFEPAVLTRNSLTVAFVAVSTVFPAGYEARAGVPGIATLRAHTFYVNPDPSYWNPGCAPLIITAVDEGDSALAEEAVGRAAELADVTVASVHWGDPFRPHVLTDCEPQVAQLLVDAGADIVLGHHQHLLRGTGFVDGKPVFYGLGNIACDLPGLAADLHRETPEQDFDDEASCVRELGEYGIFPRAGYPLLPFHPDARRTVVARCDVGADGITSVGLYPCRIAPEGAVEPLRSSDGRHQEDLAHMRTCMEHVPMPADLSVEDDDGYAYWRLSPR
ncbi:CapA family protein [Streptomyces sp. NRRL F-5126]|uniref:CapA family protein n=1 Tax=Streptomyces sp. NRRL F-5126 TaxID=1463857 RepID=UPI00068F54E0|nr:CapA family protein [Streptomyces sp. NRRL F-5126]